MDEVPQGPRSPRATTPDRPLQDADPKQASASTRPSTSAPRQRRPTDRSRMRNPKQASAPRQRRPTDRSTSVRFNINSRPRRIASRAAARSSPSRPKQRIRGTARDSEGGQSCGASTRDVHAARLPMRMPTNPTARHLAVDEVSQGLRHRLRANDARPTAPGCETQSKRPLQHKQQTATHRIKSSGTLLNHQDPSTESPGLLAIQKVAKAAAHRRETCTPRLPMRMPTNPTARHLAVDEVPQGLRHRPVTNARSAPTMMQARMRAAGAPCGTTATHRIKLRAIDSHLVPTDKAAGELAIQKVRRLRRIDSPPYDRRPQRLPAAPPRDNSRWTK